MLILMFLMGVQMNVQVSCDFFVLITKIQTSITLNKIKITRTTLRDDVQSKMVTTNQNINRTQDQFQRSSRVSKLKLQLYHTKHVKNKNEKYKVKILLYNLIACSWITKNFMT